MRFLSHRKEVLGQSIYQLFVFIIELLLAELFTLSFKLAFQPSQIWDCFILFTTGVLTNPIHTNPHCIHR
jgi:hypothetical protein